MKTIINLLLSLALTVSCSAQIQTIVKKCPNTHKHTCNYYLENKDARRIYFYKDTLARTFHTLLKRRFITYKELFVALGFKKIKYNQLPYCDTGMINYTHKDVISIFGITINDASFDRHHKYAILLDIATRMERFSVVCVPIKRNRRLENIRKSDLMGKARVCMVDL
jgi:hypothetical protein